MHRLALPALGGEPFGQPRALIRGQPMGVARPIGKIEVGDKGQDDRRRSLDDEEPLSTIEAADAVHAENKT